MDGCSGVDKEQSLSLGERMEEELVSWSWPGRKQMVALPCLASQGLSYLDSQKLSDT